VTDNPLWRILFISDRNIKEARDLYAETCGRRVDDPAIEEELHQALRDHPFEWDGDAVTVPAKLVLAIALRPRGKGRGRKRPSLERYTALAREAMVDQASRRWRELVDAGEQSPRAKRDAANELHKLFGKSARIDVRWLEEHMRKADVSNAKRKKRR
jgi:hypothetical protein